MRRSLSLFMLAGCLLWCGAPASPVAVVPAADVGVTDAGSIVRDAGSTDAGPSSDAGATKVLPIDAGPDPLIVARPYRVVVPPNYNASHATPLVVLLHGYSATAQSQDDYFQLSLVAQSRGFLLALPEGTKDQLGLQFWNATDACCGFGATVDDVAYLTAVIGDLQRRYHVDANRIHLFGHSNGAFMAHRMACDRSELVAGIVAFAGDVWNEPAKCSPTKPVAVLQVHGTNDAIIRYFGGLNRLDAAPYPPAETSIETWAKKNNCTAQTLARLPGDDLDLTVEVLFPETWRRAYGGCPANGAAELWTAWGASHIPLLKSDFSVSAYEWLAAHPKP